MYATFTICCYILAVIISLLAALGITAMIIQCLDNLLQKYLDKARHEGRQDLCDRLRSEAYWFSEDPAVMDIIRGLANREDLWSVRDRWRNAMNPPNPSDQRAASAPPESAC